MLAGSVAEMEAVAMAAVTEALRAVVRMAAVRVAEVVGPCLVGTAEEMVEAVLEKGGGKGGGRGGGKGGG